MLKPSYLAHLILDFKIFELLLQKSELIAKYLAGEQLLTTPHKQSRLELAEEDMDWDLDN